MRRTRVHGAARPCAGRRCLALLLAPARPAPSAAESAAALACLCAGGGAPRLLGALVQALTLGGASGAAGRAAGACGASPLGPDDGDAMEHGPDGGWDTGDRAVAAAAAMLAEEAPRFSLLGCLDALALLRALGAFAAARGGRLATALRARWPPGGAASPGASPGAGDGRSPCSDSPCGHAAGGVAERGANGPGAGLAAAASGTHCRLALHLQLAAQLVADAAAPAAAAGPAQQLARRLHDPLARARPAPCAQCPLAALTHVLLRLPAHAVSASESRQCCNFVKRAWGSPAPVSCGSRPYRVCVSQARSGGCTTRARTRLSPMPARAGAALTWQSAWASRMRPRAARLRQRAPARPPPARQAHPYPGRAWPRRRCAARSRARTPR